MWPDACSNFPIPCCESADQMGVTDITGPVREGMWNYDPPFPSFHSRPLGTVPWAGSDVYCEVFEGLHSQSGTYLETPAHYYGNGGSYLIADVPAERLVNVPCTLLMLDPEAFTGRTERCPVTAEMLGRCSGSHLIGTGEAILVGSGWGSHWMEKDYLAQSPFFTLDAMRWLLGRKPFLLGSDIPRWENLERPEGFFPEFYAADVLMLAPCVNLETASGSRFLLTALPMNIHGTSCAPCRAVLTDWR
jgi:arylformamidase